MSEAWDHPVFKTREEFEARIADLLLSESGTDPTWWYLSFGEPGNFLGGCYVKARGGMHAVLITKELGFNPGGEVLMWEVGEEGVEDVAHEDRFRLLSAEEIGGVSVTRRGAELVDRE